MILAEYEEKFDELYMFTLSLVDIKDKKVKKFLVGLKAKITRIVASQHHGTYSEVLQRSQLVA